MARTFNHQPYDVQMRAAWGNTEAPKDIDPLTGDERSYGFWKGARADRCARGVGTVEWVPGARIGGNNPAKHREYLGRPRHEPTSSEFDYDDEAEAAFLADQRELDELSADIFSGSLDEDYYDDRYEDVCGGPCEWSI